MQRSLELVRWSLHSWRAMLISEQGGLWLFYVFQKQKPAWQRGLVSQSGWVSARRSLGTQYTWKSHHSNDAIRKSLFSGTDSVVLSDAQDFWRCFSPECVLCMDVSDSQVSLILLFHGVPAHHLVSLFHMVSPDRRDNQSLSSDWQLDNISVLPKRTHDTLSHQRSV